MKKYELVVLPEKWIDFLVKKPADRGGYQTGIIVTHDGDRFKVGIANSTYIYYSEGYDYVPFSDDDINEIIVTNEILDDNEWLKRGKYVYDKGYLKEPLPTKSILRK